MLTRRSRKQSAATSLHETYRAHDAPKTASDRSFGLVFAAVFLGVALWPMSQGGAPIAWALALAGGFFVLALARPRSLSPLKRLWLAFGAVLHRLISPLVLALLFFGVFVPVGFLMRLWGQDPMRIRERGGSSSYWIKRDSSRSGQFNQQF